MTPIDDLAKIVGSEAVCDDPAVLADRWSETDPATMAQADTWSVTGENLDRGAGLVVRPGTARSFADPPRRDAVIRSPQ